MPGLNGGGQQVRFGVFEADLRAGELRRSGLRIKLQPQPFRILALLLEEPGQVITRERLQAELWPNGTHVEFDLGLNAAVKKLRRSLGDDAQYPKFIETLPRVGYRFVYPVERISTRSDAAPPRATSDDPPRQGTRSPEPAPGVRWKLVWAVVGLIVAGGALAGLLTGPTWRALTAASSRTEEMLFSHRFSMGSRVSPNGSLLAYVDSESGHLWIVDLATSLKRELVPHWVTSALAWSRDNSRIAFVRRAGPSFVWEPEIVDVATGDRTAIAVEGSRIFTPWDWTSDGRIVCTVRGEEDRNLRSVALYSPEERALIPLREVGRQTGGFRLSPDDRFIVYTKQGPGTEERPTMTSDVLLLPVHGDGPIVTVAGTDDIERRAFWSPDGRRVLYIRGAQSESSLWSVLVDPATGEAQGDPVKLTGLSPWTPAASPSVSPTGEVFVSRASAGDHSLRLLEVDPQTGSPRREAQLELLAVGDPDWSRDGQWLRYRSRAMPGSRDMFHKNRVERNIETGEERIVEQRRLAPPDWLYDESAGGGWAILAQRGGNRIRRRFFDSSRKEVLLEFDEPVSQVLAFQDGKEILFATHSKGRDLHRIRAFRLSDRRIRDLGVSRNPPQWVVSPYDDEVALGELNCLVLLPREGGPSEELACASPPRLPKPGEYRATSIDHIWATDLTPSWSPDGTKIAWTVAIEERRVVELWIVNRLTGAYEVAWAGEQDYYTLPRQPRWSPTGKHIAFAVRRYRNNELWVLRGLL